jgi:hypothetical protein
MPVPPPQNNKDGLAGLLSAALAQVQIVQAADDETDGKAHNLMAAALVVVALNGTQVHDVNGLRWLTVVAILVMIAVVGAVMYITREQEYESAVVNLRQHPEYFTYDSEFLLAQLIEDATNANRTNLAILKQKQAFLRHSVYLFLVGFALGIVALFINA